MTERVIFTFPAEIQMVLEVDPMTGAVTITESVVVPNQSIEIAPSRHFETEDDASAIPAARDWLDTHEWPSPTMSADGVSLEA